MKNYLVPARQNVFHNRDFAFKNKESRLSGMIFFHVIAFSRQNGFKQIFMSMRKACKLNPSGLKLEKMFLAGRNMAVTKNKRNYGWNEGKVEY